jgi:hypothetical protein
VKGKMKASSAFRFEERVMAFVDILGFRAIVHRMSQEPELFITIRDVLKLIQRQSRKLEQTRLLERKRERNWPKKIARMPLPAPPEMSAFSDCYVISERAESGWQVLVTVQALAAFLLYKGIYTRGGIVKGGAYHNGPVLFGSGVISAYELQTTARYPRIVVEDRLVRSQWWLAGTGRRFFVRDSDGCWFVNPLERPSRWQTLLPELRSQDNPEKDFLLRVRQHIVRDLSREMRTRRRNWEIIAKLRWLAATFNNLAELQPGVVAIDLDRPSIPKLESESNVSNA